MSLVALEEISVRFGTVAALSGVSVSVDEARVLAVLGPSGSGKSTLLRTVAGLESSYDGRVLLEGRDLRGVPTHKRGFALMFQDGQLFWHQSVARNIGYPLRLRRRPRAEVDRRVAELLELVGLDGFGGRRPEELSGGERQRVALARALAVRPQLLLLDEPLSALDRGLRSRLAADLREILTSSGTTALLVTHDHEEAFALADDVAVMQSGRVARAGTLAEVWADPREAETARVLGYETVLSGEPAAVLARVAGLPVTGAVAVRGGALVLSAEGSLTGRVLRVRPSPEGARVGVDVVGVGELEVSAGEADTPGIGTPVRVRVGRAGIATVRITNV